jgi:hypothetical protein
MIISEGKKEALFSAGPPPEALEPKAAKRRQR